jgi:hypothetical protein
MRFIGSLLLALALATPALADDLDIYHSYTARTTCATWRCPHHQQAGTVIIVRGAAPSPSISELQYPFSAGRRSASHQLQCNRSKR